MRPRPVAPKPLLEGPLAALLEWQAMAEGAYSANTLRAQKADGAIFQAFCESRGEPYLPAGPKTIRAFIDDRVKAGKRGAKQFWVLRTLCDGERAQLGCRTRARSRSRFARPYI
jgi:hypothetical protein